MVKREIKLSRMEKIFLYLNKFNRFRDQIEVPPSLTQEGIVKATGIALPKVSITVRKLEEKGLVYEKVLHIQGSTRRRKAYFLTDAGIREAQTLQKGLEVSQYIDFADQAPQLRYFYGRKEEFKVFRDWFESDNYKVLVVSGIAGIGKTAYVVKAVEPYRESMHIFWHRFNEWSTLRNLLTRLGEFLSEVDKESLSANLRAKDTIDLNEISIILANNLEYLNALLVFDDFQKVKEKKDIGYLFGAMRQTLENVTGTKIVVVGREIPRFFYDEREVTIKKTLKEITLGGLDRESSLKLLEWRGIVGPESKRLYELTRGHPLSLELIYETERFESQDRIERFMRDEIFSHLTPQEIKILEIASAFRFPIYPTAYLDIARGCPEGASEEVPRIVLGLHSEEIDGQIEDINHNIIDGLMKKSLLQVSGGVCDIHDQIREFVYGRLPHQARKEYHKQIAIYYLHRMKETAQTTLEAQYHFLMAEMNQQVVKLAIERGKMLIEQGFGQEMLVTIKRIPFDSIEPQQRPEILLLRGYIYEIQGELDKGLEDHRQSIRLFRKVRNKTGEAEAYRRIGDIMWRRSRWEKTLENYRKALEISQQVDDLSGVGEARRGIGRVLWRKGDLDMALLELNKALDCSIKVSHNHIIAGINIDMGNILGEGGDNDKAIECYNKSLSILEQIGDKHEMVRAYNSLGASHRNKGDMKEAINWSEKAIKLAEEIGDIRGLAYSLSNAAEGYVVIGDVKKALEYCKTALPLSEKLEEISLIIYVNMVYGLIYDKKGDWVSSEEHLKKAIDISTTADLPYIAAQVHLHYGQMLVERGKKAEAKKHFDESIKIWKKLGNDDKVENVKDLMNRLLKTEYRKT